jgi:hypothetical protein
VRLQDGGIGAIEVAAWLQTMPMFRRLDPMMVPLILALELAKARLATDMLACGAKMQI